MGTDLHITGPRLKAIREQYGVTQTDLAQELGVTTYYLSRIECGSLPVPHSPRFLYREPTEGNDEMFVRARKQRGRRRFASVYVDGVRRLAYAMPPVKDLDGLLKEINSDAA